MSYGLKTAFEQGRAGPARKLSSNRMTYTSAKYTVSELLMMGRGTARNMYRFIFFSQNKFGSASVGFIRKKFDIIQFAISGGFT